MTGSATGAAAMPMPPRPLDPPARGIAGRLDALSQLACSAHSNHLIAFSRTICAFVLLLFALTDALTPGFRVDFDGTFALAFACFAVATLILSFRNWYLDYGFSGTFIAVDILAFAIFIASRTTGHANSAVPALYLLAHILFSSMLRWRSGLVVAIAVLLNLLWAANIVLFEMPGGGIGMGNALRWSLFVVLTSLLVIWASAQTLKATLPRFTADDTGQGIPLAASAIGYAMQTARASDAILCWIDREDLGCYMSGAAELEGELPARKLSFGAGDAFGDLAPMLFDMRRGRAIVFKDGKFLPRAGAEVPGQTLLAELGAETGLCIPADGDEGRSWLILLGIPYLGWGHLHLADAIRAEIDRGLASQAASAKALDSALLRLRRTVAYDLHDSVAHSLAGARFLLVALRSKVGANSEVAREIDIIKDALDAEHLHVRRLIEQLRETDTDPRVRNLIEDLEAIRQTLASRWQIRVELVDSDFRIDVPVWLSLEIQQLTREAISNGVRHGKATEVTIICKRRSGMIEIEAADNGSGFSDPQNPALPRSISERLSELGGTLEIRSRTGSTVLRMSIPSSGAD